MPTARRSLALATIALAVTSAGCFAPTATPDPLVPPDAPALREMFDSRILGSAEEGFYVEGVAFHDGRVFAGTAFGATGDPPVLTFGKPSRVYVWNLSTGDLVATILVEGEDTTRAHGAIGLKTDALGRLYVLSSQLGLLRFTETAGEWTQETLATFPDIPMCSPTSGAPCSPTATEREAIGNDMTWGPDGALYVSDSFQASVWRVAPDGEVTLWHQDAAFDRAFGPNGLRVSPDGTRMILAVTGPDSATVGPADRGSKIFSIAFPDPSAAPMETVLTLPNGDLADGIAFGARGDLYALSNAGDRIFVLANGTRDITVISNDDLAGDARMHFPASLAFDGAGAMLVANYAFFDGQTDPAKRSVIDVFVDDAGWPEPLPSRFMD